MIVGVMEKDNTLIDSSQPDSNSVDDRLKIVSDFFSGNKDRIQKAADKYNIKPETVVGIFRGYKKGKGLEKLEKFIGSYDEKNLTEKYDENVNYRKENVFSLLGKYQLVRPSLKENGEIVCSIINILWDDKKSRLNFFQEDITGPKYPWKVEGFITIFSHTGVFNFVSTDNRHGRYQMMSLLYDTSHNYFYGISLTVSKVNIPIAIPVVMLKEEGVIMNKLINSNDEIYNKYLKIVKESCNFDIVSHIMRSTNPNIY
jgi:hypothetical protein